MVERKMPDPEEFEDPLSDFEPVEYASDLERALAEAPVSEIRSRPYAQIESTTPIRLAVHALHGLKVSSLLVVDGGRLVGIFTERDVLEKVAERFAKLADAPVGDVMTAGPLVVYEGDPVGTALAAIAAAGHRHVPVLAGSGEVSGIVSPHRVLSYLEQRSHAPPT